jgi:hypothetical protein
MSLGVSWCVSQLLTAAALLSKHLSSLTCDQGVLADVIPGVPHMIAGIHLAIHRVLHVSINVAIEPPATSVSPGRGQSLLTKGCDQGDRVRGQ